MARKTHRPATVAALMLALSMTAMEMTVVSTAMPTVVAELGGASHYAWVFTVYMLTTTVAVPLGGKLADLYGRKPVALFSLAVFLIGSMASGQATSMTQLIAFRAVQGVGAGGLQPMTMTIVGDIFPIETRARMQGLFGSVWAISGLVGPLLGGLIVSHLSWRWVFYVNVPFGLLSGAILTYAFVEDIAKTEARLDLLGAGLLTGTVVTLLLGSDGHAPAVTLPLAAVLLAAFVWVERRAKQPVLSLALLAKRIVLTSSAISALSGAALLGVVTFVPLLVQGVLGRSPTEAGATIAPLALAWPVASAISGRLIPKFGFRGLVRVGGLFLVVGAVWVAYVSQMGGELASIPMLRVGAALFGIGMGLSNTSLIIAVQSAVTFRERGVATASSVFFRNIGGTLGVGVMGAVLTRTLSRHVDGQDAGALVAKLLGPERRNAAAELTQVSMSLNEGIVIIFWLVVAVAVVAAVIGLLFPHAPVADAEEAPAAR